MPGHVTDAVMPAAASAAAAENDEQRCNGPDAKPTSIYYG